MATGRIISPGIFRLPPARCILILDDVAATVSSQLDQQAALGVDIENQDAVPDHGPVHGGVWLQIPEVTAVFADIKGSTALNNRLGPGVAIHAYTFFNRAMVAVLNGFQARYVDVQGDAVFGLFSGKGSRFQAAAAAITMKTQVDTSVADMFRQYASSQWEMAAGIGVDRGKLLVRQLGIRGTGMNEVWAGTPVNTAAKLSSVAEPNEVVVSERVFADYENSAKIRRRALLRGCGCRGNVRGRGLDLATNEAERLWKQDSVPDTLGLDFDHIYRLPKSWCPTHGAEFCEAIITRQRGRK